MARSLLRQLEQIRNSVTYDDAVASVYTAGVAETVSGTLEGDMNVLRTLLGNTKGKANWYDDLGNYFDPTDTDGGSTANKALTMANLGGNTLDSKTVIISVSDDNAGAGYTVSGTSTGVLMGLTTAYALPTNRTGLPIFASTANNGTYFDEGGADTAVRIDVIDIGTQAEFQTTGGDIVYAKFHDAADFSGTGTGTDVYARFYANGSPVDLSSIDGGNPVAVGFVYPYRKQMSQIAEHEWHRTDFVSSWEGDVEIIEDISNLWGYTGATDGDGSTTGDWTNTTGNYSLNTDPADLFTATDALNDSIGDMTFTEDNYLTDGQSVAAALDALDIGLQDVADTITTHYTETKYTWEADTNYSPNSSITVPATYTPDATSGQEGSNMDVYMDGQLLAASTGAAGVNADRDYAEVNGTTVQFHFNVRQGSNVIFVIRA